jgi:hypothetical protein
VCALACAPHWKAARSPATKAPALLSIASPQPKHRGTGGGTINVGGTVLEQDGELTDAGKAENSALAGINRDTTNTNKALWSSEYSQELDVTVDNRLFTEEGRKAIKEDIERTERLGTAIADVATKESFELQDTLQHIDETQKELDVQKAFALANDSKNIEDLQGNNTTILATNNQQWNANIQLTKLEILGNALKANGVALDAMLGDLPAGSFNYDTEDAVQDFITRHVRRLHQRRRSAGTRILQRRHASG